MLLEKPLNQQLLKKKLKKEELYGEHKIEIMQIMNHLLKIIYNRKQMIY